ncbi:MAG: adenylyl-sulfate kinase [Candidatus Eremiobacteraeota bacterium]|nr:adenylyl-sulfate kinase [Candidatus Eremiobacteraeota bacterium]
MGDSIGFTLDRDVYLERGETAFLPSSQGVVSDNFSCQLLWLGKSKLQPGKSLCLRVGTQSSNATVLDVESVTDYQTLERVNREWVERNELANITVRTAHPIAIQRHAEGTALGRLAFFDGVEVVGAALVVSIGEPSAARVTGSHPLHHRRRGATSHEPAVFWLTGLPCAGKTTLANALEERLLARGITCCVLDGDDLRATINSDLGFSVKDRLENVRRVAWMAQILSELGFVVIVSLIAPYTASRTQAREIIGESFFEIFVQAELQSCMRRDVKGLYKDAQRGKIEHLTGISAIYEPPAQPDLTIDTDRLNVEASSDLLMEFVQSRLKAPRLTV